MNTLRDPPPPPNTHTHTPHTHDGPTDNVRSDGQTGVCLWFYRGGGRNQKKICWTLSKSTVVFIGILAKDVHPPMPCVYDDFHLVTHLLNETVICIMISLQRYCRNNYHPSLNSKHLTPCAIVDASSRLQAAMNWLAIIIFCVAYRIPSVWIHVHVTYIISRYQQRQIIVFYVLCRMEVSTKALYM